MKLKRFLIPSAASLLVVTGLLIQRRTTLGVERENEQGRQRLSAVRPPATHALPPSPEGPIQCRTVLKHPRSLDYLRERIQRMTKEEMIAALEEIAACEALSRDTRGILNSMFQQPLCDLYPELGLNWFIQAFQHDRRAAADWQAKVFYQWAQRDPATAIAWYERQLADGKFEPLALDGRSGPRNCFGGALAGLLMATDPAGAAKRMSALSMGDRVEALWVCSSMAVNEATDLNGKGNFHFYRLPVKPAAKTPASPTGSSRLLQIKNPKSTTCPAIAMRRRRIINRKSRPRKSSSSRRLRSAPPTSVHGRTGRLVRPTPAMSLRGNPARRRSHSGTLLRLNSASGVNSEKNRGF